LDIKYYNSCSNFDTKSFAAENVYVDAESDILSDTQVTPCPKMLPSEAVNAYNVSVRVQPLSLDHSLETALGIPRRERRTTYTS
jgi:hypothetical protein